MKRWIMFFTLLGMLSGFQLSAQVAETAIEAEGKSVGNSLQAHDEALNRALRNAIEQGVGSIIDSETMVSNFQLLDDQVYSQVKGYVTSYEVINDNQGQDGLYVIRVRAVVALGLLEKNLKALKITMKRRENPRVMFIFAELIDGLEQAGAVTQTEMERAFLAKDFPLVDKNQIQMIKERDAALSYADPQKAAALGRQSGAEMVVVGQATADLIDHSRPYGVSVFAYRSQISARVIKTDTAEVMVSDDVEGEARGGGRIPTAKDALRFGAGQLADKLMSEMVEKMRSEAYNVVNIQVVASGVNATAKQMLVKTLEEIRGIQSVNERSFVNNILILDLTVDGAIWKDFDVHLENLPGIALAVTAKSQNRIDVKWVGERQAPL
ncbi:MAG: hypothetical protein HYS08_06660 [Chlamydiae bacterium]|nr:hypothetical protein [Chlamydiota bacterium]MBI3267074.1 hypothetical protein [Chlamydiota bacterium]